MPKPKQLANFIPAALSLLALNSIAYAQNNLAAKVNGSPAAPVTVVAESDRSRDGLAGPVRRVRTEISKLSNSNGTYTEGKRLLLEVTAYDIKGGKTDNQYFPVAGASLTGKEVYKYDDKGNISEMTVLNADGSLLSKEMYRYDYDNVGNWVKMTTSVAVIEGGKLTFEPTEVTYRAISYYLDENMLKMSQPAASPANPAATVAMNPATNPAANPGTSSAGPAVNPGNTAAISTATNNAAKNGATSPAVNPTAGNPPANSTTAAVKPANNKVAAVETKPAGNSRRERNGSHSKNAPVVPTAKAGTGGSSALNLPDARNDVQAERNDGPVVTMGAEPPPVARPVLRPLSGGVLNGRALALPPPAYPEVAKRNRISGVVSVEVVVDETGKVISAQATDGPTILREVAAQAALRAKFSPTKISGLPVKVTGQINYKFALVP